ncbi:MAG: hypothetical protein HGB26_02390 [Desulfobulbaceae bacterium]|nr:hypothetical protein [Desulfobulbaceae bacterium]
MNRTILVLPESGTTNLHDLFICAIGYEERSTFAAKSLSNFYSHGIGIAFQERRVLNYESNYNWCLHNNFVVFNYNQDNYVNFIHTTIDKHLQNNTNNVITITVDISSMSRPMLAQTLIALWSHPSDVSIEATFVYSLAIFSTPTDEYPVTISCPVIPEFAGWSERPDFPSSAIVGLGYEKDQALATIDNLEPYKVWLYYPKGKDQRYEDEILSNNTALFGLISEGESFKYPLDDPFTLFCSLESLVYSTSQDSRPTIIPFGPKLFSLVSMLVALCHYPKVTIWRVSGEQYGPPIDSKPEGSLFSISAKFFHPK